MKKFELTPRARDGIELLISILEYALHLARLALDGGTPVVERAWRFLTNDYGS